MENARGLESGFEKSISSSPRLPTPGPVPLLGNAERHAGFMGAGAEELIEHLVSLPLRLSDTSEHSALSSCRIWLVAARGIIVSTRIDTITTLWLTS